MPSHKVSLTNRGFKILSTDLQVDFLSIALVGTLLIFGWSVKTESLLLYAETFFLASLLYLFYRYKFGYIYFAAFFYQIILFLLITPISYLNTITILLSFVFTFPFLLGKNSFQKINFPMSLFMSLVVMGTGLVGEKLKLLNINKLSFSSSLESHVPGFFFVPTFSGELFFSEGLFSPIEMCGLFALLGLGILFLREFSFFLDLACYSFLVGIFLFLFQFDLELYKGQIIALSTMWFLLLAGPGRNFGFSYIFSFISLVFTATLSYLFWKGEWNLPPILVMVTFFLIQSLFFVLVMGKFLQKIPFLKSVLRK